MSKIYIYDIKKRQIEKQSNDNKLRESSTKNENEIYISDEKQGIVSIENKLNKLIWLFIGIILLFILSIILFWSVTLTCLNCVRLYYYLTDEYISIDPINNNNNNNSTGYLLLHDGTSNVFLRKFIDFIGNLTNI